MMIRSHKTDHQGHGSKRTLMATGCDFLRVQTSEYRAGRGGRNPHSGNPMGASAISKKLTERTKWIATDNDSERSMPRRNRSVSDVPRRFSHHAWALRISDVWIDGELTSTCATYGAVTYVCVALVFILRTLLPCRGTPITTSGKSVSSVGRGWRFSRRRINSHGRLVAAQ